jgi:patatin-related protein
MDTPTSPIQTAPTTPPVSSEPQPDREIRFAVVIYGGVSLTIYVNGIVQEMLNMVRSTAETDPKVPLTPLQRVYRELAYLVGDPASGPKARAANGPSTSERKTRPGRAALRPITPHLIDEIDFNRPTGQTTIHSKFVVDILSGTSAGGINAIFLAKALANNMSIDSLAKLWITQADLKLLLNDKQVQPAGLRQVPPPSLLNSRWMYLQLLNALNDMNGSKAVGSLPLVQDLDLFCTTTDLHGLPVDIALTDESVTEQRYRNVYHFRRRTLGKDAAEDHDFVTDMDPFLAFAARCTSSFPVAFEPMQLGDITDIVKANRKFKDLYLASEKKPSEQQDPKVVLDLFGPKIAALSGAGRFADICRIYEGTDTGGAFATRSFGDGGYLNNKPFTYAIETIKKRHAMVPVDRKLIYIEPAPEHISRDSKPVGDQDNRPTAVENSLDALVVLPPYETIRQDIEHVIHWNSDIIRLQRVLSFIEERIKKDRSKSSDSSHQAQPADIGAGKESRHVAASASTGDLTDETYFRLRLSGAADQLGCRLADAMNVDPSSAIGEALRAIVGVWRDRALGDVDDAHDLEKRQKLARFLDMFDFDFCERAIRFLRGQLQREPDKILKVEHLTVLAMITADFTAMSDERLTLQIDDHGEEMGALKSWTQYLTFITDPYFAAQCLSRFKPPPENMEAMLTADDAGLDRRVHWLFNPESIGIVSIDPNDGVPVEFWRIVDQVAAEVILAYGNGITYNPGAEGPFVPSDGKCYLQSLFDRMQPLFDTQSGMKDMFLKQDVQVYSIVFGTNLGEFEPIEIFRISPGDTRAINGTAPPGCTGNPPLRGASLDAFGAFLDQEWRLSDMLRGRLDGAERLITAVLPDSDPRTCTIRERLIARAQEEIAVEWVKFQNGLNLRPSDQKIERINEIRDYEKGGLKPAWLEIDETPQARAERRHYGSAN